MRPCAATTLRDAASTEARSATSSASASALPPCAWISRHAPRPASPRRARRAPRARPRRRSAAAMARPIPREAPVTSETCPSSSAHHPSAPRRRAATVRLERVRRVDVQHARVPWRSSSTSPLSTVPGPTSTKVVTPSRGEALDRLLPAHRARDLPHERRPRQAAASRTTAASTLLTSGRLGVAERRAPRAPAPAGPAPAASARSGTGADTGSGTARLAPAALHLSEARATAAAWPAITTWPGELTLAGATTSPSRRLAAGGLDRGEVEAEDRGHRPDADGHGLLHVLAARAAPCAARRRARARRPPRAPSTRPGCGRPRSRAARRAATSGRSAAMLVARIAGWVLAVSCSSASGPSKQSFESGKPSAASACAKTSRLSGNAVGEGLGPCRPAASPGPGRRRRRSRAPRLPGRAERRAARPRSCALTPLAWKNRGRADPRLDRERARLAVADHAAALDARGAARRRPPRDRCAASRPRRPAAAAAPRAGRAGPARDRSSRAGRRRARRPSRTPSAPRCR